MTEVLTDYMNSLFQSFITTLNTPEDYMNKAVLTTVIFVISLLLRLLFKK